MCVGVNRWADDVVGHKAIGRAHGHAAAGHGLEGWRHGAGREFNGVQPGGGSDEVPSGDGAGRCAAGKIILAGSFLFYTYTKLRRMLR